MSDDITPCVNGLITAFHNGTERTQEICNAAARNTSASKVLETVEPAQALQKSLADSVALIRYTYIQSVNTFGGLYAQEILNDSIITNRFHALTINLQDQLSTLSEYFEGPGTFDLGSLQYIRTISERCREQAIKYLKDMNLRMLDGKLQGFKFPGHDDRAQLSSQSRPAAARPPSQVSPMQTLPPQGFPERIASVNARTPRISGPSHYEFSIPKESGTLAGTSQGSYKAEERHYASRAEEPSRSPQESEVQLIDRAEVARQMSSNETFLEKRRMSKVMFQKDMENLQQSPTKPTSPSSPRPIFAQTSPRLTYDDKFVTSPVQTSRPNNTLLGSGTQGRGGQTTISPTGSSPRNSNATLERQKPAFSDLLVYEAPESPPLSSGRQSAVEYPGFAGTPNSPRFDESIEDGKQVVDQVVSDPGLIPASEIRGQPTPATSVQSVDYPINHNSSFYKYGGFCKGANMLLQGVTALKVTKRPGAHLTALVSMKCVECKYEIGFDVYEKDNFLDKEGIYSLGGIRFRQRFLSKCHLPARKTDDSAYACIFCIEEAKTVDDYDATVFFSVNQLFTHLQKHTRPVKVVEGIKTLYGQQVDALDFDMHFMTMEPQCSPFASIAGSFREQATAHAIADHHKRSRGFYSQDPEKRPTLQFALGARIVGVTFSERTNGTWCFGYHDSDKGYFPASTIALDPPSRDEIVMNRNSRLWATAKWDHKPREANPAWLIFSKKDKITNIGFAYKGFWCWTGHYKGKWGLFPACYVENLKEEPEQHPTPRTPVSGDSSPRGHGLGSFSLSRKR